jgi:hypothetical protein
MPGRPSGAVSILALRGGIHPTRLDRRSTVAPGRRLAAYQLPARQSISRLPSKRSAFSALLSSNRNTPTRRAPSVGQGARPAAPLCPADPCQHRSPACRHRGSARTCVQRDLEPPDELSECNVKRRPPHQWHDTNKIAWRTLAAMTPAPGGGAAPSQLALFACGPHQQAPLGRTSSRPARLQRSRLLRHHPSDPRAAYFKAGVPP